MGSTYDPSSGAGQATWHSIAELSLQIPTCSRGYSHEHGAWVCAKERLTIPSLRNSFCMRRRSIKSETWLQSSFSATLGLKVLLLLRPVE
jgi:hypothetical protein